MSGPVPVWHAGLLAVPLTSIAYDMLAGAALRHWMREPAAVADGELEPVTFFRPLKRGVPHLREKLEMLLTESTAEDQILLGVDAGSEEEIISEKVCSAHPERDLQIVVCEPGRALNPKISKLIQMMPFAKHAAWLLSDSEMVVPAGFLTALRGDWQASNVAALTTAYRFINLASWPQRLDGLGVLLGLWPGIALVRRYGRVNFTLGACTLFRREALLSIGGWEAFGHCLAEDQRLGEALVNSGHSVRLSRQVATLDTDLLTWRDYWRHQRRVSVTYRVANPAGFAGVLFTFGPVWSLACLSYFYEPWLLLGAAATIAFRFYRVRRSMRMLGFSVNGWGAALSAASFVEALCWLFSWISSRVWWSGRWWRVNAKGGLSN